MINCLVSCWSSPFCPCLSGHTVFLVFDCFCGVQCIRECSPRITWKCGPEDFPRQISKSGANAGSPLGQCSIVKIREGTWSGAKHKTFISFIVSSHLGRKLTLLYTSPESSTVRLKCVCFLHFLAGWGSSSFI